MRVCALGGCIERGYEEGVWRVGVSSPEEGISPTAGGGDFLTIQVDHPDGGAVQIGWWVELRR